MHASMDCQMARLGFMASHVLPRGVSASVLTSKPAATPAKKQSSRKAAVSKKIKRATAPKPIPVEPLPASDPAPKLGTCEASSPRKKPGRNQIRFETCWNGAAVMVSLPSKVRRTAHIDRPCLKAFLPIGDSGHVHVRVFGAIDGVAMNRASTVTGTLTIHKMVTGDKEIVSAELELAEEQPQATHALVISRKLPRESTPGRVYENRFCILGGVAEIIDLARTAPDEAALAA
jgi:hypothetical protein